MAPPILGRVGRYVRPICSPDSMHTADRRYGTPRRDLRAAGQWRMLCTYALGGQRRRLAGEATTGKWE